MSRRPYLLILGLALAVVTCRDALGPREGGGSVARIAVAPTFPSGAALADFGLTIDRVRIIVVRPIADTIADTTAVLPPDADFLDLDLRVPLLARRESLSVTIQALAGSLLLFSGTSMIEVRSDVARPEPVEIPVTTYVGPGAGVDSIVVEPRVPFIYLNDSLRFQVQAFQAGAPVTQFYVAWSTSDTSIARVNGFGVLRAPSTRTSVRVRARTPSGVTDSVTAAFVPLPTQLAVSGGDGQSGSVGQVLETPLEVEVRAADGLPVGGVAVRFRALTGGLPADTTVVSDASGRARVTGVLGPTLGSQTFEASLPAFPGIAAMTFGATATAGPISAATSLITASAGTVLSGADVLLTLQGKDDAGNDVGSGGASVVFTATGGTSTGTIGPTTDHGDGTYTATFTGITAGTATTIGAVIDDVAVTSTPLPTISVIAGAVASVLVTPDSVLLDALNATQQFTADAFDRNGNPVATTFTWTSSDALVASVDGAGLATALGNGTTTLGATADGVTGSASLSVTQVATHLAFLAEPSDVIAGDTITPAVQVKALDSGGSVASNFTGSITLFRNDLIDCGATLLGTTTASAVGGVAAFGDLHVLEACVGLQLGAQSDSLAPAQSVPFSVLAGPVATVTVLPGSDTLHSLGDTTRFAAQAEDAFGNVITGATFVWTSTDTVVAAVNQTGVATAHANGLAQIVATSGGIADTAELTVQQIVASVTVMPDRVLLTTVGETVQLAAVALDSGGSTVSGATFTWASSDALVGTVDTAGLVTAVADGTTNISATTAGVTGSAAVTVNLLGAATRLVFTQQPPSPVFFNDTFTVQVEAQDDAGNRVTSFSSNVTLWEDTVASKNPGSRLQGTLMQAAVNGVATFAGLFVDGTDTTGIEAVADALVPDTSVTFHVVDQIVLQGTGPVPYFAGVDAATNRIYVSNRDGKDGGTATVLDGGTLKVANTVIGLGPNPGWEGVNPTTKRVFISDSVEGTLYIIDEGLDAVLDKIAVGANPTQPAVNWRGDTVYVPVQGAEGLSLVIVDMSVPKVVGEVLIGARSDIARGAVWDPATGLVWLAVENLGIVTSFDPVGLKTVNTITVGEGPYGVALDSKANRLYVSLALQNQVAVIDLLEGVPLQPIPVEAFPQGLSVDVDSGRVFVANRDAGTISVIDVTRGGSKTIVVGRGPGDAEFNPRNRLVYVPNGSDNSISIVKP